MPHHFYQSSEYRLKQSALTRKNWEKGTFNFLLQKKKRGCARKKCQKEFFRTPSNPKKYCSRSCAAKINNTIRKRPEEVNQKISQSLKGRKSPYKGVLKVPRISTVCANSSCKKTFAHERYILRKFCSNRCVMDTIGGQPTSPKASKGKAGIRKDISPTIYFYSRWEANIARLYTHLGISWEFAPTSFDIGGQRYTPDFYLSKTDTYIEVKNFWWEYSKVRDEKFRKIYPHIRLDVILKPEYLRLEKRYAHLIPTWEYKNTKFYTADTNIVSVLS